MDDDHENTMNKFEQKIDLKLDEFKNEMCEYQKNITRKLDAILEG
mgnify:CR=1 FL=1